MLHFLFSLCSIQRWRFSVVEFTSPIAGYLILHNIGWKTRGRKERNEIILVRCCHYYYNYNDKSQNNSEFEYIYKLDSICIHADGPTTSLHNSILFRNSSSNMFRSSTDNSGCSKDLFSNRSPAAIGRYTSKIHRNGWTVSYASRLEKQNDGER